MYRHTFTTYLDYIYTAVMFQTAAPETKLVLRLLQFDTKCLAVASVR